VRIRFGCGLDSRIYGVLRGSVHTIKENAEALIVARKKIGLEVKSETKYMVVSRDQDAG